MMRLMFAALPCGSSGQRVVVSRNRSSCVECRCHGSRSHVHPHRVELSGLPASRRAEVVQHTLATLDAPTLVTGVLPELDAGLWLGRLADALGSRPTEFQVRGPEGTALYEASLQECLMECATQSRHDSAVFVLDEALLSEAPPELQQQLYLPPEEWGANWFRLFPPQFQPSDCLLIGGAGARSTLHADPFSWYGYNYLMEGTKLWTFFPPSAGPALDAYPLEPNAWGEGEGSFGIAVGWESPVDLYMHAADGPEVHTDGPLISHEGRQFLPSHEVDEETIQSGTTFVQSEGELLLIPPDWWHQTYHLSPTVAIASQMLNHHVAQSVFAHILDCAGMEPGAGIRRDLADGRLGGLPPDQQVRTVMRAVCGLHLGQEEGARMADSLFGGKAV